MRNHVFVTAFATLAAVSSNAVDSAGCDESRVATAHYAGQVVVEPQPTNATIPCASAFGPTAQAAPVAVLADGTVFGVPIVDPQVSHTGGGFDPLPRIARSPDRGATWQEVDPPDGIFSWMSSDPTTDRLWYTTSFTQAQGIAWSDDGGQT